MAGRDVGFWCISDAALLAMLRRVAAGEDPDLVYAEEYANAEHWTTQGDAEDDR